LPEALAQSRQCCHSNATPVVNAYIGGNAKVKVAGDIIIDAIATPRTNAEAIGVNVGALAVGASIANATATPLVTAYAGGSNTVINADTLSVVAATNVPDSGTGYSAKTKANRIGRRACGSQCHGYDSDQ